MLRNSILIVERGSDIEDELLYFSIKEKNAVNAGAKALLVYNNVPGIFLGELVHEFVEPGYEPQIPVVSIDMEEGMEIIESIKNENQASMHLFYNPDFVTHFSSRGPVSPFYIKPEIVAPGAFINTTQNSGGYNFTSGTSYAAPHVSGAAALLLQKNPEYHHHEIKSLLLTTAKPVSDAYGQEFSIHDTGAGRLDIGNAYAAKLIIMPPNFVANVPLDDLTVKKQFKLKLIEGTFDNFNVEFEGPEFIKFVYFLEDNILKTKFNVTEKNFGDHEGKIIVSHDDVKYTIPFLLHYTPGSISVNQQNQKLFFEINHPKDWSFAKISVTNSKNGRTDTTTATPNRESFIDVYENSEYWIESKIKIKGNTSNAYNIIKINSIPENVERVEIIDLPKKQIGIIAGMVAIIGIIGLVVKRK